MSGEITGGCFENAASYGTRVCLAKRPPFGLRMVPPDQDEWDSVAQPFGLRRLNGERLIALCS